MNPQLTPTISDAMNCAISALEEVIAPVMDTQSLRSTMTSTLAVLRYVEHRVRSEGQLLLDEKRRARELAAEILRFAKAQPQGGKLTSAIDLVLNSERDPDIYPSLELMAQDVAQLRQIVCDAIDLVAPLKSLEAQKLMDSIRVYTAWQILHEETMIAGAFRGHGPRR